MRIARPVRGVGRIGVRGVGIVGRAAIIGTTAAVISNNTVQQPVIVQQPIPTRYVQEINKDGILVTTPVSVEGYYTSVDGTIKRI